MTGNPFIIEHVEHLSHDLSRTASPANSTAAAQTLDTQATDLAQQRPTPVTVININGKHFVAGLFWQPLTEPRTYLKEARAIGKREAMKWLVLQRGSILQAGFVGGKDSVRRGMFSLAVVLTRKLGRSWIGIFPLEGERYALVAVSDGAILPGCDMIAERQIVQAKFNAIYRCFNWENIFLPDGFADADFAIESPALKVLLKASDLKRADQLQYLAHSPNLRQVSMAIIAFMLVVGLLYLQSQAKQRQRMQEMRRQSKQLQQLASLKAQSEEQAASQQKPTYPWATLPSVDDFLKPCMQAVRVLPLVMGGWQFDQAKCVNQSITATYVRQSNATANDFLAEARNHFELEPAFYQQGEHAVVQTKFNWQLKDNEQLLKSTSAVLASFSSHFQTLGMQPQLTEKLLENQTIPSLPGQQNDEPAAKLDWRTFAFSLNTGLAPDIVLAGLDKESIRLIELSVHLQNDGKLSWHIAGEIYAK